uniref:Uncharacterized protein n=1 Tax=Arundo donax TaxID=35708 RepID=A0A0A9HF16_ARUDO
MSTWSGNATRRYRFGVGWQSILGCKAFTQLLDGQARQCLMISGAPKSPKQLIEPVRSCHGSEYFSQVDPKS